MCKVQKQTLILVFNLFQIEFSKKKKVDWNEVWITWLMFTDRHTHTQTWGNVQLNIPLSWGITESNGAEQDVRLLFNMFKTTMCDLD